MTQRDELAGALGGLNSGHPRGCQRIALGKAAGGDQRHPLRRRHQRPGRHRRTPGRGLRGDVDHVCRATFVDMRESTGVRAHWLPAAAYLLITVTGCVYGSSSAGTGNVISPYGDNAPVRSAASSLTAWSSTSSDGQPLSMYGLFCDLLSATSDILTGVRAHRDT